ncbi:MAG: TAXI family TRAP transporter solute-binding subunit [Deltaproteobacteria bacterium]|nr:TAXI family TRAP transporter solute-binding subunit [Deltaproteobacteria bacterium]
MRALKFKVFAAALTAVLVPVLMGISSASAAEAKKMSINMGSTSSTSAVYAWCVATANVINKANVGLNVTVVESGAALDNLRKLKSGAFDFALSIDIPSAMQMYQGIDSFKGQPWKDVRVLFIRNVTVDRIYVRKDSGIKTFTDLSGKKFSPGIPGASSTLYMTKFDEVLKSKISFMPGALGDSINAFQSGKIVGLQKTSPLNAIDASLIEVNMTTPITAIGFAKGDTEKIRKVYPYIPFIETPKGTIAQVPDAGPMYEEAPLVGAMASKNLPDDVVYNIVKSYYEGIAEVAASYPAVKGWNPVSDFFKYVPEGAEVPAHAGMIRYAKEKGIDVPKRFIPAEYKGK